MTEENGIGVVQKPRVEWIDLAKGMCMLLVVWVHVFMPFRGARIVAFPLEINATFYFRMPLYFFLSGLFFKTYGSLTAFTKKKINKLLIPFVTFTSIGLLGDIIWYYLAAGPDFNLEAKLKSLFPFQPIWFLWCLFLINIIFFAIQKICRGKWWLIYPIAIALGVISLNIKVLPIYLHIETAFAALPFFVAGYALRQHTDFLKSKSHFLIDCIIIAALIYALWKLTGAHHENIVYNRHIFGCPAWALYLGGLLGTAAIMLFARMVKWLPIISYIGRYSIIVLITHHLWICFLSKQQIIAIARFCGGGNNGVWCMFAFIILVSVPTIWFCKRFLPYVFAQKDAI